MSYAIVTQFQMIISFLNIAFGNPYFIGAFIMISIMGISHVSELPSSTSITLSAMFMLAVSFMFMPDWIVPFLGMIGGVIVAYGIIKSLGFK